MQSTNTNPGTPKPSNCLDLSSDWLLSYWESQSEGSSKQLLIKRRSLSVSAFVLINFFTCNKFHNPGSFWKTAKMVLFNNKNWPEILTLMKDLDKPTVGPVHLQLFRPSVIRGPCIRYLFCWTEWNYCILWKLIAAFYPAAICYWFFKKWLEKLLQFFHFTR